MTPQSDRREGHKKVTLESNTGEWRVTQESDTKEWHWREHYTIHMSERTHVSSPCLCIFGLCLIVMIFTKTLYVLAHWVLSPHPSLYINGETLIGKLPTVNLCPNFFAICSHLILTLFKADWIILEIWHILTWFYPKNDMSGGKGSHTFLVDLPLSKYIVWQRVIIYPQTWQFTSKVNT